MRVYLDTCVYCRPFDDQSPGQVAKETEALAAILGSEFVFIGSDVLDDEVEEIESMDMRIEVKRFLGICKEHVHMSSRVVEKAKELVEDCGLTPMDALHIASAIGKADFFITCDGFIIKKAENIKGIKILDPVSFAEEYIWK